MTIRKNKLTGTPRFSIEMGLMSPNLPSYGNVCCPLSSQQFRQLPPINTQETLSFRRLLSEVSTSYGLSRMCLRGISDISVVTAPRTKPLQHNTRSVAVPSVVPTLSAQAPNHVNSDRLCGLEHAHVSVFTRHLDNKPPSSRPDCK